MSLASAVTTAWRIPWEGWRGKQGLRGVQLRLVAGLGIRMAVGVWEADGEMGWPDMASKGLTDEALGSSVCCSNLTVGSGREVAPLAGESWDLKELRRLMRPPIQEPPLLRLLSRVWRGLLELPEEEWPQSEGWLE